MHKEPYPKIALQSRCLQPKNYFTPGKDRTMELAPKICPVKKKNCSIITLLIYFTSYVVAMGPPLQN